MFSDVSRSEGAKDGIGDGVTKNIGVRVAFKPALMRNLDAAENEFASIDEAVGVVTDAATKGTHSFKSITPFVAMML
jgi:hypothetical protein